MVTLIDSVGVEASTLVSVDASMPGVWGSVSILTHVGDDADKPSIAMDVREGLRLRGLDAFEAFGASAAGSSPSSSGSTWQVPPYGIRPFGSTGSCENITFTHSVARGERVCVCVCGGGGVALPLA